MAHEFGRALLMGLQRGAVRRQEQGGVCGSYAGGHPFPGNDSRYLIIAASPGPHLKEHGLSQNNFPLKCIVVLVKRKLKSSPCPYNSTGSSSMGFPMCYQNFCPWAVVGWGLYSLWPCWQSQHKGYHLIVNRMLPCMMCSSHKTSIGGNCFHSVPSWGGCKPVPQRLKSLYLVIYPMRHQPS